MFEFLALNATMRYSALLTIFVVVALAVFGVASMVGRRVTARAQLKSLTGAYDPVVTAAQSIRVQERDSAWARMA
jgi:hypothetical protein